MRVTEDAALRRWRETTRAWMREAIGVEYCRERYREREYPHAVYDGLVEQGWLATAVPEALGGQGGDHVEQAVLLEALGRYGYDFGVPALVSMTGFEVLRAFGTDAQVERWRAPWLDGDVRFTIGITEPETGSDAAAIATTAERDGDAYVLDGTKTFQSGAGAPGAVVACYARTDPDAPRREGLSLLLVPTDADGVETRRLPLVARKASGTHEVYLDGVRVPADHLVGEPGDGWAVMQHHLVREHTGMAALMVGTAQEAVDAAVEHARERETFGRPIGEHQAVTHRLADLQTDVDAARLLVYRSASAIAAGEADRRLAAEAKLAAGETLETAGREAVQLHGGAGLLPEEDVERYWREGKSATIAGATSEIQRSVVGRALLREGR